MTYMELYRLKIQPEGEDKVKSLADALAKQKAALTALEQALRAAGIANLQANREYMSLTRSVLDLERAYARAEVGASRMGRGFNGNGLLQLGYFFDDLQYGMRGVANNIPGLLMSFGAGAGLAGVLSVVSTVAAQVAQRWDSIAKAFGMGATQTEAQAMEALAKATERTVAESEKLERYNKRKANSTAQAGATDAESGQQGAVNDAVRNAGKEDAIRGLVQLNRGRYVATDGGLSSLQKQVDAFDAKLANTPNQTANTPGFTPEQRAAVQAQRDAINAKLEAGIRGKADADLANAATDPDKLRALTKKIIDNQGAFGPNAGKLAVGLMGADPTNQAGEKESAAGVRKQIEAAKQAKIDQAKADEARNNQLDSEIDDTDEADAANLKKRNRNRARNLAGARGSGVGGLIAEQLKGALENGGVPAFHALGEKLKSRLTEQFGANAAGELMKDAGADAQRGAIADMLRNGGRTRNSQTIAAGNLSQSIQAGVGGDNVAAKQLEHLRKIDLAITASLELQKATKEKKDQPRAVLFR